jgi:hypothetical protein
MANIPTIPMTVSLQLSFANTVAYGGLPIPKLIPRAIDGSVYDCTGVIAANLTVAAPTALNPNATIVEVLAISVADATGITLSITEANTADLAAKLLSRNVPCNINALTATDAFLAATGNLAMQVTP